MFAALEHQHLPDKLLLEVQFTFFLYISVLIIVENALGLFNSRQKNFWYDFQGLYFAFA